MTKRKKAELSDRDHDEILNNREADGAIAAAAIEHAVHEGMSREQAVALYGHRPTSK